MPNIFGCGDGWLSEPARKLARAEGAELVNFEDPKPSFSAARGRRRHWFAAPNRGEPFDSCMARSVIAAIRERGTDRDRAILDRGEKTRSDGADR